MKVSRIVTTEVNVHVCVVMSEPSLKSALLIQGVCCAPLTKDTVDD